MYKSSHSVILHLEHAVEQLENKNSAVLLPQLQNFYYAAEKFLLFCFLSSRILILKHSGEKTCYCSREQSSRIVQIRKILLLG